MSIENYCFTECNNLLVKNLVPASSVGNSKILTKRARNHPVDAALGIGHPNMPADHVLRGLARIARRGIRSAIVRETAGVSFAVTKDLPEGLIATRSGDEIVAYRCDGETPPIRLSILAQIETTCEAAAVAQILGS